jgi:monovalent cation:H+ antiporter-2, CPA2 family
MNAPSFSLITTFMLLLSAAIGGGTLAVVAGLPSVVGYIAGGIVIGNVLATFVDVPLITMIADVGVTLLLFTIGLEFSFQKLRRIFQGIVWLVIAQLFLVFLCIMSVLLIVHISFLAALYIASASAISSTAIIVKILSERGEMESIYGELSTGWLVIQDLAVVPLLIVLAAVSQISLHGGTVLNGIISIGSIVGLSVVFTIVVVYLGRFGVPKLLTAVAGFKNKELLLLTTIGIVFFIGILTSSLGLSAAIGAFLAGLLIAETSQNHAVFAEIRPLRDVFAVVFFVSLGMTISVPTLVPSFLFILSITIGIMIVKIFVIFGLLRFMGYHRKTAFLVSLALTPLSELGFVLATSGTASGALTPYYSSIVVASTFFSIILAAPLITNGSKIYYRLIGFMKRFPKIFREKTEEHLSPEGLPIENHVVICGYGRVGKYIGRALQMANIPFVVVDYNQATLKNLKEQGIQTVYGDPADKGVLDFAQVDFARILVVAIPDRHTQELIISHAMSLNRRIKVICRTHHEEDQQILKALGVQTVIQPEFEAALSIISKLLGDFGVENDEISGKITRLKIEHGVG